MRNIEILNRLKYRSLVTKRFMLLFLIVGGNILLGASKSKSPSVQALVNGSETEDAKPTKEVEIGGLKYGNFAGSDSKNVASIGGKGSERQLQNVSAGQITKDSTNAINGSQLYETNKVLSTFANSVKTIFGGEAKISQDGKLSMSNIGGTDKNTIDEAIKPSKTEIKTENNSSISITSNKGKDGNNEYKLDVKTDNKTILKDSSGNLKVNVGKVETKNNNGKMEATVNDGDKDKIATTGDVVKAINSL
ncbi:hypothetical protein [Streptobacillus ratti]|uniref:hypothetical protein n=1 Tax=Streptobacillus ratti TaxID=1720557 RepID=UPI00093353D6|nr:hypothetical protein [Streptobacillus ratti]